MFIRGSSQSRLYFGDRRRVLHILISLLAALCCGIIAGAIVPLNIVFLLIGFFAFVTLFVTCFYYNLVAGMIIVLVLTLLFNSYMRIDLAGFPDITLGRVAFSLVAVIFLISFYLRRQKIESAGKIELLMLVFSITCIFSSILSGTLSTGFSGFLAGYGLPFSYFFVSRNLFDSNKKTDTFIHFTFTLGIYVSLMGIFELFGYDRLIFPPLPEMKEGYSAFGFLSGHLALPAATGTLLSFSFLCGLYITKKKKMPLLLLIWFSEGVILVAIFFCYTRAVYLGLVIALMVLVFFSRSLRRISLVLLFALSVVVAVRWSAVTSYEKRAGGVGDPKTLYYRIAVAKISLHIFLDHPIFGSGLGTFVKYVGRYRKDLGTIWYDKTGYEPGQHNSYLGILAELGLVGFIQLMAIYFLILKKSLKIFFTGTANRDSWEIVTICLAIFAVYFVNSSFIEMKSFEAVNDLFFIFLGIATATCAAGYPKTQKTSIG